MRHNVHMMKISIRDLHLGTGRWVRRAAGKQRIIITDHGNPVAELAPYDPSAAGKPLPDREKRIRRRSKIRIDSAVYISDERNGQ
jgi:antitoxin (DNA-binding transcriptional repressor) of toxin-antitoxin stability system